MEAQQTQRTQALAVMISALVSRRRRRRQRTERRWWVKPWIMRRFEQGAFPNLGGELQLEDPDGYRNFLRIDATTFEYLTGEIAAKIQKKDTNWRSCIAPDQRLAITLRYLATGESYVSLSYTYRVGATTIGYIIPETCQAIYEALREDFLKAPNTAAKWKEVANGFYERWNYPHCLGALDGKHILIKPPPNSGSTYFNYKHSFSIVLMALVDADYRFLYVDVGANGRVSDGGVLSGCTLYDGLINATLNIPEPEPLPGTNMNSQFVIVADEAFPLRNDLMKPYAMRGLTKDQRIHNYRLSRARRVVENAFGILANRFRVFMAPIRLVPEKVQSIVLASCTLHNMLRSDQNTEPTYTPPGYVDNEHSETHQVIPGAWRRGFELPQVELPRNTNYPATAKALRDQFCQYFNGPGALVWQDSMI